METFNLEHQYQLFLHRMKLSENNMHPQQKIQLKQTFFGAVGQTLILFKDELSNLEEDKAVWVMEDLLKQVSNFFNEK